MNDMKIIEYIYNPTYSIFATPIELLLNIVWLSK